MGLDEIQNSLGQYLVQQIKSKRKAKETPDH